MKTLIITDSNDATTDVLINYLGVENVFRLNFDLWYDYEIYIDHYRLEIKNRYYSINLNNISKVYWRKPFNADFIFDDKIDLYLKEEIQYIFREIFNLLKLNKKVVLIKPYHEKYFGKIIQLHLAKQYFNIPNWQLSLNREINSGNYIMKSLSSEPLNNSSVIYTSKTNGKELDIRYPWFIQDLIDGNYDLTIVHVDGINYGFTLDRSIISGIDWRKDINKIELPWQIYKFQESFSHKINLLMKELDLKFGRLDFIIKDGINYFLEVNPNGQYAWLDLNNNNGLLKEIIDVIDPNTPIRALI